MKHISEILPLVMKELSKDNTIKKCDENKESKAKCCTLQKDSVNLYSKMYLKIKNNGQV